MHCFIWFISDYILASCEDIVALVISLVHVINVYSLIVIFLVISTLHNVVNIVDVLGLCFLFPWLGV